MTTDQHGHNNVLIGLSLLLIGATVYHSNRSTVYKSLFFRHESGSLTNACANAVFLLCWPVLFGMVVEWDTVNKHPLVLLGFGWTVLMILWDTMTKHEYETIQDALQENNSTKNNANVIVGAAWAVGSLLMVVSKESKQSPKAAKVLLISLILCVAFIIPTMIEFDPRTPLAHAMRRVQRNTLHYAIGLFVTGVTINWVV
jgi:hypothetical protein